MGVNAMQPRVSVIMTVFNGAHLIARSVESVLAQSLRDFELVVLDDGSEDETVDVLSDIDDPRLRVIRGGRLGRARALNAVCVEARGTYIANLDADDISFPERLKRQAEFLDGNDDHVWVGCGEERFDTRRNEHMQRCYPLRDRDVRRLAAKCIPFTHSGIMFRRDIIDRGINYDPAQKFLIDFEFFIRVAQHGKVANLEDVLVRRDISSTSFFQSQFTTATQNQRLAMLCARAAWAFGLAPTAYAYPFARLAYPMLPDSAKRVVRRSQGVTESNV